MTIPSVRPSSGDDFGETIPGQNTIHNPWRFPGQYCDEETGLHYNRFRYYAPALGRYISRDPVTWLNGFNFYVYAGNNPINDCDATGLLWGFIKKAWNGVKKVA